MDFLFAWYNIIFLIPLCIGVVFLLGSAAGLLGDGDVDHDVHLAEVDHDVAGDHDVESDAGHMSHVVPHDHGHGHEHDAHAHDRSVAHRMLEAFGIGRVPVSIVLTTAAFLFGGVGTAMNFILAPMFGTGWIYGWISLFAASTVMVFGTGAIARFIARVMPTSETHLVRQRDLVGRTATMLFNVTTGEQSYAQVTDHEGNLHQIAVRATAVLAKNTEAQIIDYDTRADVYTVVAVAVDGARVAG